MAMDVRTLIGIVSACFLAALLVSVVTVTLSTTGHSVGVRRVDAGSRTIIIALDGDNWTLTGNGEDGAPIQVRAAVPGNAHTALWRQGIINDPYYRFNDVEYRWIDYSNWTYHRMFEVSDDLIAKTAVLLVCDGLDTIATVYINGKEVGQGLNQFVRYVFNISSALVVGTNELSIVFTSAVTYAEERFNDHPYRIPPECPPAMYKGECHVNMIRKAACSFSWDWGPAFATQGIWKNIWLEGLDSAVIRDVVPHVSRTNSSSDWDLNVTIHLDVAEDIRNAVVYLEIASTGFSFNLSDVTLTMGKDSITMTNITVPRDIVKTWWPRGYGDQPLYDLAVTLKDAALATIDEKTVKMGFRTVVVVEEPLPDGLSFYFVINEVPIYMKGSNWIPVDSFQDNVTPERLLRLLESAVAVNMNTIRVWGGGIYEDDQFYDLADQFGLLIWQDLMFACNMYPVDTPYLDNVEQEITHQIRRLARHPSLVAWTANNENEGALVDNWYNTSGPLYETYKADYVTLYIDTIRRVILNEDYTRPFFSSSPSNGKVTEQNGWISEDPKPSSPHYGDIHYYNYIDDCLDYNIYLPTRYSSEYGYQSWPSHETLSKVSTPSDLVYGSEFTIHRQHHYGAGNGTEQVLRRHFTWPQSTDPEEDFKNIIYLYQATQAVCYKSQTEFYRRARSDPDIHNMGALYWQHNDIWQAPSWATIDYDMKWKMAHYFAAHFFADPIVSPVNNGSDLDVYAVTDDTHDVSGVYLVIKAWLWSSVPGVELYQWRSLVDVPASSATLVYRHNLDDMLTEAGCTQKERCFLTLHLQTSEDVIISPINPHYLVSWKDASGMVKPGIQLQSVRRISDSEFQITMTTNNIATFVWLEALNVKGYFSDNGFLWMEGLEKNVTFKAWQNVTEEELLSVLSVKSLADIY